MMSKLTCFFSNHTEGDVDFVAQRVEDKDHPVMPLKVIFCRECGDPFIKMFTDPPHNEPCRVTVISRRSLFGDEQYMYLAACWCGWRSSVWHDDANKAYKDVKDHM